MIHSRAMLALGFMAAAVKVQMAIKFSAEFTGAISKYHTGKQAGWRVDPVDSKSKWMGILMKRYLILVADRVGILAPGIRAK